MLQCSRLLKIASGVLLTRVFMEEIWKATCTCQLCTSLCKTWRGWILRLVSPIMGIAQATVYVCPLTMASDQEAWLIHALLCGELRKLSRRLASSFSSALFSVKHLALVVGEDDEIYLSSSFLLMVLNVCFSRMKYFLVLCMMIVVRCHLCFCWTGALAPPAPFVLATFSVW